MKSRSNIRFSTLTTAKTTLVALAIALGGCASGSVALRPNADVRGKAIIAGAGAHAIASGPARLLHVDVLSGRGVNIYTVQAKANGSADCQGRALGEIASLHRNSNELNLELAPGEVACLALADGGTARADVAWHARPAAGPTVFVAQR
jgi:hypothetical protein